MDHDISDSPITTLVLNGQESGQAPVLESAPANSSARIPELDGLRGCAILLVILCHYIGNAKHAELGFWWHRFLSGFTLGWSGVDLFFVLSGFLIGGILLDARTAPHYFRAFYMRRVYRILPIYYVWTLLFGVLVAGDPLFFPGGFPISKDDLLRVPVQLLFLQNVFIGMPAFTWVWFAVTWSLAVEEQFYLLAPPLIRLLSLRNLVAVLGVTILVAPFLRFAFFRYWSPGTYAATFVMPCRADTLAWGILLALGWRNAAFRNYIQEHGALLRSALLSLAVVLCPLVWWFVHPLNAVTVTIGYTVLAIFYSCLLLVVISQKTGWLAGVMRWKALGALGTISYCVYVIHLTFNHLTHWLVLHAEPQIYNLEGEGVTLLALVLTLAVASLSWRYFEKPLVRRGHGYSYGKESSA
jgi:peptidoglycan/LPS O-acetylase OafA/YrhL